MRMFSCSGSRSTCLWGNTIPAHPLDTEGLDVSGQFKQVLDERSRFPQAQAFGHNIDLLTPQNFMR